MPEFKFSCPQCGQHIQCDPGYIGLQINCPACQKAIIVPPAPSSAAPTGGAAPPPVPSILATRQSTTAPASGQRFAGAPSLTSAPPPKPKSKTPRNILIISACVVVLAGLGAGGWFGFTKFKEHKAALEAKKGNPAARVTAPTATATVQALSILMKVHAAYTNLTTVTEDSTVTLSLDLSNLTMGDLNPNMRANARTANRHPQGMPRMLINTTDISMKRAHTNWFYLAGEAVTEADRRISTNTFAIWSAGKGMFMFDDQHKRGVPATYMQMPDTTAAAASGSSEQVRNLQHLFEDPAQLTKIIKDLGQTGDESVNGQDCYTLTAKVLGQKVKIWVNKTTYLIAQSQITLGGAISDADIDDAFSLFTTGFTNTPPGQLEMIKAQVKQFTPAITKIRGTITSTVKDIETNPTLTADDFDYSVPPGVRLIRMPGPTAPPRRTN